MKLLFLYRYGILGGVTAQIRNRARALVGQADFSMAFLDDRGDIAILAREMPSLLLQSEDDLHALLEQQHFDLITCIDTPEVYPWLQSCNYTGPILHEVHTTTYNLQYLNELDRSLRLNCILTPSYYMQRRLLDEFNLRKVWPVQVLANCLDTDLFQFTEKTSLIPRPIVLWVGKLDDHKNWRAFLEVSEAVHRLLPDCEFWMVGGRTALLNVVYQVFEELQSKSLLDRLRWIHTVPYTRMPAVYSHVARSGGLTLSVSKDESFGMSVAEAMACQCPVVCPTVGALPELLEGELAGGLYPAGNFDTAARLVASLLGDAETRTRLGTAGLERVVTRYSLDVVGPQYLQVLQQCG